MINFYSYTWSNYIFEVTSCLLFNGSLVSMKLVFSLFSAYNVSIAEKMMHDPNVIYGRASYYFFFFS